MAQTTKIHPAKNGEPMSNDIRFQTPVIPPKRTQKTK